MKKTNRGKKLLFVLPAKLFTINDLLADLKKFVFLTTIVYKLQFMIIKLVSHSHFLS